MPIDLTREIPNVSHAQGLQKVKEELKANKWGVLSDIDVREILKEKLGVEIESYNILDVCNPQLANEGLKVSKTVGLVMPCKMSVYNDSGKTKISLYLPTKQLPQELRMPELEELAEKAEVSLKKIVENVS
jgi:uncharacterized protein (DUF302 family)